MLSADGVVTTGLIDVNILYQFRLIHKIVKKRVLNLLTLHINISLSADFRKNGRAWFLCKVKTIVLDSRPFYYDRNNFTILLFSTCCFLLRRRMRANHVFAIICATVLTSGKIICHLKVVKS